MTNENDKVKQAQAIRNVLENLPAMLELATLEAKVKRGKFLAFVREGFTEAQALELIRGPL